MYVATYCFMHLHKEILEGYTKYPVSVRSREMQWLGCGGNGTSDDDFLLRFRF